MKKQNGIYRLTAMVLILILLMSGVSRGADGNDPEAQAPVYSDWLRLDDQLEDQDASSGTQDLSLLLQQVALLDTEGTLLAQDGVWPVVPNTAYQIQLRFRETPGNGELQFDTAHAPLQYQLPEGLYIGEENLTLPVRIELDDSEFVDAVCACDAALGTLSVSWDPESAAEEKIRAAEDAGFTLILPAVFGNVSTLGFTPNLAVSLQRVETAPLTAEGTDYIISVTGTADARIPEGARLVAA